MSLFYMALSSPSLWFKDGHYLQWKERRSLSSEAHSHFRTTDSDIPGPGDRGARYIFWTLFHSLFLNLPPFLTYVYPPWANLFRFTFSPGYWFFVHKHFLPPQIANMFHWSFLVYFLVSSFCTWSLFCPQGKECRDYSYTRSSGYSASDGLYVCQTSRKAEM